MDVSEGRQTMRRRTVALSVGMAAVLAGGAVVSTAPPASAATGCTVTYTSSGQWPGGFGADVTIKNLGDAISSWTLTWSFGVGQTVTSAWSAAVTQSGSAVTAKNVSYNGSIATNGAAAGGGRGAGGGGGPAPAGGGRSG